MLLCEVPGVRVAGRSASGCVTNSVGIMSDTLWIELSDRVLRVLTLLDVFKHIVHHLSALGTSNPTAKEKAPIPEPKSTLLSGHIWAMESCGSSPPISRRLTPRQRQ